LREAEAHYRAILQSQPGHFDALHLYGVLTHQRDQSSAALKLIGAALAVNAQSAAAHCNYGIVLAALERYDEALSAYDRAIALKAEYPEAFNNRGNALRKLQRYEEALASFDRALTLKPDYAEALNNRGNTLIELQRPDEALASYDAALVCRPDYADALINRSQVLHRLERHKEALHSVERALALVPTSITAQSLHGRILRALKRDEQSILSFNRALSLRPDDADDLVGRGNAHYELKSYPAALADYDRALALRPDAPQLHNNKGNALCELGRLAEALESFDRALALDPDYAEARNHRGNVLLKLNDMHGALAAYDDALALKPDFTDALVNRGNVLDYLGRADEALASFDRAIAADPQLAEAHWNRALLCLALGDFARGFAGYEWRWRRRNAEGVRDFTQPIWRGEDLHGKTILLHAEQGFGDTIQFVRYMPMVAAKAGKVILELPDSLRPLTGAMEAAAAFTRRGDPLPAFDVHCPLMSLPLAFGTTLETIPATVPYLRAPGERIERLRPLLPTEGQPRIGLVWSGKPTHKNDHNRTIPLAALAPVLELPHLAFVSLQCEYRDGDWPELERRPNLARLDGALADFADTAAAINELDLVIAVDTAVAHLAGALGKPVWILLSHVHDWRWLHSTSTNPWYPTARLFRQPAPGDWTGAIGRIAEELADFQPASR